MYTNTQVPSAQEVFLLSILFLSSSSSCFLTKEQKHKQTRDNNNDGCEVFVLLLAEWKKEQVKNKQNERANERTSDRDVECESKQKCNW